MLKFIILKIIIVVTSITVATATVMC